MEAQTTEKKPRKRGKKTAEKSKIGYFDRLAEHYDRLQPVIDPIRYQIHSVILDIINAIEPHPENVLELGCRTGMLTAQILELRPDAQIYAIDNSLEMLKTARRNLDEFIGQITLAKADFRDPWEDIIDEPIDLAVHYSALGHLPHDALREIYTRILNVLRPGGWLIHADITDEKLPEPVRRIAESIADFRKKSAMTDFPGCESVLDEMDEIREGEKAEGLMIDTPAMPEQQVAWLVGAGFEFATRVFQDWRISLFVARKPE